MDIQGKRTGIVVLIALLWGTISILGWNNMYMPGLYLGVLLMLLHMVLGVSAKQKLSLKFLVYPLLPWAAIWALSFYLSDMYANAFAGVMPSFSILGFHPSFSWTVILYWVGGMLTLTWGFIMNKDEWLSSDDWDEFKKKVALIDQKQKGGQ
ncbi:hypothetical protein [Gudongella oleilytica]|uniref:hypothetical protein n=1 Tax=Gudongella oleilytica TaxID=1582259 RepID=UPI002A358EA2|nr:hypothetical protein [Gudongella oleilytica]MDY0257638.1 hypothetical protein [Gudongella oleilytica]